MELSATLIMALVLAYLPVLIKQLDAAWKSYQEGVAFSFSLFIKTTIVSLVTTLVALQVISVESTTEIMALIEVMLTSTVITLPIDGLFNRILKRYLIHDR